MAAIINREHWLARLAEELAPKFAAKAHPLPIKLRLSCGFHAKVLAAQMRRGRLHCPADGSMLLMKGEI